MEMMLSDISYHGPVVVFDLDDTLYMEREFAMSGLRAVAEEGGLPAEAVDRLIGLKGEDFARAMRETMQAAAEKKAANLAVDCEQAMGLVLQTYRYHRPVLQLKPEVKEMLNALRKRGVQMGIITDGRSITQRNKIAALGLDEYVPASNILISEETGKEKPSMAPFVQFVRQYPEAGSFWYVGDNTAKDFVAPRRLGWHTVCIKDMDEVNIHRQDFTLPVEYLAEYNISSPAQLLELPGLNQ